MVFLLFKCYCVVVPAVAVVVGGLLMLLLVFQSITTRKAGFKILM